MVTFFLQTAIIDRMKITHLNPDTLYKNPAFSQAVSVKGAAKMVYIGGQNGVTADGKMTGDDFGSQTEQAYRNVLEALKAVGASQENVVKLTVSVVQGQDIRQGFAAAQKVWGMHATAISVLVVAGLANPQALVEIDAIAAVEV
jgi:enamine deaminase RidA (YjgF/YER057c/UK114 family)